MRPTARLNVTIAVLLGLVIVTSSCTAPPQEVKITMTEYRFDPADVNVRAGRVDFIMVNMGNEEHDLSIAETTGPLVAKSELVKSAQSGTLSVTLKPGKYVLYCGVALHRDRGMEGTLTVR
jgi:plastocyanin